MVPAIASALFGSSPSSGFGTNNGGLGGPVAPLSIVAVSGTPNYVTLALTLYGRPLLVGYVTLPVGVAEVVAWLRRHRVRRLNCAGPRESGAPGVYRHAKALFIELFAAWARSCP